MPSAEPREVLMTADAVGGVWTYAFELTRALAPHGVRVSIAVMGPPPSDEQRAELAELPGTRLFERPCRLEWMDDPWQDVEAAGDWLLQLESDLRPDVVHVNGYAHAALPWRAPVVAVGHSCVYSWWDAVHGGEPPRQWARYARAVRRGLRHADLVIAPTAAMLAALEQHYGRLRRARVIANGRSRSDGAAPKEAFVLAAGRLWDEAKNIEAVCAVAPALGWPVYIAGEWRFGRSERPASGDAVRWLGPLGPHAIEAWMGRASIYALPARYEPFGLSALEAALAGCALVLGDIRSLREVWGDAAVFVPADNRRALASALTRLIEDETARHAMAHRARARAAALSPGRMAADYLAAYCSVVRDRIPSCAEAV